jgi:phosphoribosylglycinamide formyltransferase 1
MKKIRLAIFASGSGSNAEAICRYFNNHPSIEVSLILSNNASAAVLEKASTFSIDARTFKKEEFKEPGNVLKWLHEKEITHLVLAGFLWLIPTYLIRAFPNAIINIHPALLPKYGGKGMYGIKVHEAVKAAGEKETGITIHEVNEYFDEGKHLFQSSCPVNPADSPETIAKKVLELEHAYYPKVIERWALANRD